MFIVANICSIKSAFTQTHIAYFESLNFGTQVTFVQVDLKMNNREKYKSSYAIPSGYKLLIYKVFNDEKDSICYYSVYEKIKKRYV